MRALITRPRENAGPIARALAERDIDVLLEPLLEIRPTEHGPVDLAGVQAVLVTSAFGARELAAATEERGVPVYAVGDATAQVARDAGFTTVESARGDAEALTGLVLDRLDSAKGPLLYAAGRVTSGDFPDQLAAAGFEIRRVELYAARPAAALSIEATEALRAGGLDLALFFSPRTAATFVRLVEEAGLAESCRGVTALALSPAVAEALQPLPWRAVEAAARPDQEAMIALADDWLARHKAPEPDAAPPPPAAVAAPEPEAAAPVLAPAAPARRRSGAAIAALLLTLLFGAAAAAGGYWLWRNQERLAAEMAQQQRPVAEDPAFRALQERAVGAEARMNEALTAAERRLTARLAETERRAESAAAQAAGLESRLAQKPAESSAPAADAEAVQALRRDLDALAGRVGEAEQALRRDLQGLAARLAEVEQADARLAGRLSAEAEQIGGALAALEQRLGALARTAEQAANDETAALLLAAGQIRSALEAGRPFAAPVATLQRLAGDDSAVRQALAGWSDRAAQGIPTLPALRDDFRRIAATVRPTVQPDTGQGWLDRAIGRAASVVRVRRVGEDVPGQTTEAVLARAEAELNGGDLARAVAEIESLAPDAKAAFADWLAAARARLAAREGLAALERAAVESAGGG